MASARRLLRRARASWLIWVPATVVLSAALAYTLSRAGQYEVSVVLRVTEGTIEVGGPQLSQRMLRAYVKDLALTNGRLQEVMRRYPRRFPELGQERMAVLEAFRDEIGVVISENDFVEERQPRDPPRSARLTISFRSGDPQFAWTMAKELADLVAGSTLERERLALENEQSAASAAVARAEADLVEARRDDSTGVAPRTQAARERLVAAQQSAAAASIAVRAAGERQALRFDIVDPGRAPPPRDRLASGLRAFTVSLLGLLIVAWLLAGAFDPRVLDVEDLASLGIAALGALPGLPASPGGAAAPPQRPQG